MQNCCLWTRDKTRMVAHNSRVTAKPKTSWQKQKHHGKTKNLTAKTKYLTAKPKTSRQKQNTSRQNRKPHGKNKNLTAKPKISLQNQRPHGKTKYFTAKTKYLTAKANTHGKTKAILLLLWSIWFCREVFDFAVRYFVFAVRFLVLLWQLWATVDPPLPPPARYLEESNFQNRSTVLYVINFTFHLLLAYIVLWYRKIKNWRKTLNNKKNIPW